MDESDGGDEPSVAIENTLPVVALEYPDKCYYQESDECMCLWDPSYCPGFDFGSAAIYDAFSWDFSYYYAGSGSGAGAYYTNSMMTSGSSATYEQCNNEFNM